MYSYLYNSLKNIKEPIETIVVGLGFMGYGFISGSKSLPGFNVPLVITRRPSDAKNYLTKQGHSAVIEDNASKIKDNAARNIISVSDDLDLISSYENKYVIEMTGTINYGAQAALKTLESSKHLITMNPELQATLGTPLKLIADKNNVSITDVYGDQPGSLSRLMYHAKMMGFKPLVAGNMKRYRDNYATQEKMKPWAEDKGLAVKQTVSFTDGTKQAIEMTLVSNYFDMTLLQPGMRGIETSDIRQALSSFSDIDIPKQGIVDYAIGKDLFPGVFVVAKHESPDQQKYLRYLNMGDGPLYVLFDAYHLCHLEVANTIAQLHLTKQEVINNGTNPTTATIAYAKRDIKKGEVCDGIGGDSVRGDIVLVSDSAGYLPVGLAEKAIFTKDILRDQPIALDCIQLASNAATKLWESYTT